jgi:hypothetical protein
LDEQEGRSVNRSLDQALLGCDTSHVHVIDTLFLWEKFTTHNLHLNSLGMRKITAIVIAKSLCDNNVSGIGSIPIITHARASPYLA